MGFFTARKPVISQTKILIYDFTTWFIWSRTLETLTPLSGIFATYDSVHIRRRFEIQYIAWKKPATMNREDIILSHSSKPSYIILDVRARRRRQQTNFPLSIASVYLHEGHEPALAWNRNDWRDTWILIKSKTNAWSFSSLAICVRVCTRSCSVICRWLFQIDTGLQLTISINLFGLHPKFIILNWI